MTARPATPAMAAPAMVPVERDFELEVGEEVDEEVLVDVGVAAAPFPEIIAVPVPFALLVSLKMPFSAEASHDDGYGEVLES
jgi:hypothetical protein